MLPWLSGSRGRKATILASVVVEPVASSVRIGASNEDIPEKIARHFHFTWPVRMVVRH
jgi:hypothetical protein